MEGFSQQHDVCGPVIMLMKQKTNKVQKNQEKIINLLTKENQNNLPYITLHISYSVLPSESLMLF